MTWAQKILLLFFLAFLAFEHGCAWEEEVESVPYTSESLSLESLPIVLKMFSARFDMETTCGWFGHEIECLEKFRVWRRGGEQLGAQMPPTLFQDWVVSSIILLEGLLASLEVRARECEFVRCRISSAELVRQASDELERVLFVAMWRSLEGSEFGLRETWKLFFAWTEVCTETFSLEICLPRRVT